MRAGLAVVARDPAARRICLANACSAAAIGVFLGALPVAVAQRGGGPLAVGLASAALTIWYAGSLPLGALSDRIGVGRTLRVAAPLRIPALGIIAAGSVIKGQLGLAVMIAGALGYGLCDTISDAAASTLPALIIPEQEYEDVFGILAAVQEAMLLIVGPSAGALLLITGRWLPFAVAGLSLAVAYVIMLPLYGDERARGTGRQTGTGWLPASLAGLRHIGADRFLRALTITLVGLVIGEELSQVTISPYFRQGSGLHAWVAVLGLIRSAAGLAAIAGALAAGMLARRFSRTRVFVVIAFAGALPPAVLAISAHWLPVLAGLVLGAAAEAIWVPLMQAEVARRTPRELMARTRSAVMFITWGSLPLASIVGGALAQELGIRVMLILGSVLATASCAAGIGRYTLTAARASPELIAEGK